MNIYIVGRTVQKENEQSYLQVGIVISGNQFRMFKANMPIETTHTEALEKALCTVQDFCNKHASLYENNVTVYQNLIPYDEQFRDPVHEAWQNLANTFGMNTSPFINALHMNDYVVKNVKEQIFDLINGKNIGYQFKENDLVILRREGKDETSEQARRNALEFEICARVVWVNRETNTILLDRYQGRGSLQHRCQSQSLSEIALQDYYKPMNEEEILEFRDGMAAALADPIKSQKFNDKNIALATFEIVNERAEQIEYKTGKSQESPEL